MKKTIFALIIVPLIGLILPTFLAVAATPAPNFALRSFKHHANGPDRVFELEVENTSNQNTYLRGRFVVISVYDTAQPAVLPIEEEMIAAHATKNLVINWVGAPAAGRIRALLVLSGGAGSSLVESFDFWLLSTDTLLWSIGIIVAAVLAMVFMRLRRSRPPDRAPANMVSYRTEFDDTLMTISNRYGVTWQDLVKANHLKPPYDIKPGQKLLIPRHPLMRPKAGTEKA